VDGDVALPSVGQTQQVSSTGSPTSGATASSSPTGTATGSAANPTNSKKSQSPANGGREIAGMSAGLVAVMLGFVYWL